MTSSHVAVAALLVLACITDLRSRRIPNVLTLTGALAAILFHTVTGGWIAGASSLGGWVIGAILFFPLFALRGMGAGDVKLLAAVGAWLGPAQVPVVALMTSIAGGVIALAVAFTYGYLGTALRNMVSLLKHWGLTGVRPLPEVTLERTRGPRLAYAVPIAIGTMVTLWLK